MTRTAGNEPIQVKPSSNVYTALAAAAVVATIVALAAIWMCAASQFKDGLLG